MGREAPPGVPASLPECAILFWSLADVRHLPPPELATLLLDIQQPRGHWGVRDEHSWTVLLWSLCLLDLADDRALSWMAAGADETLPLVPAQLWQSHLELQAAQAAAHASGASRSSPSAQQPRLRQLSPRLVALAREAVMQQHLPGAVMTVTGLQLDVAGRGRGIPI
ncbi:hypothetical protein GPECTOR_450g348 [Gonium pectorale]|uniref:Uncharacterized protein n=1 Tax=Gonium pectorale TaxID=33097 RepID=A0A150FV36_GONPE|nr:hypothetical protein GPECTOR_450g348 [Gonium pectorale]|eukprot:KXZ41466.1 hypothetical protein GPECTOR_450g348 [Gonium pectorale]